VAHHQNLGGAAYVFLEKVSTMTEVLDALSEIPGVEAVYSRKEGSRHFGLMADRIGDCVVLADKDVVFGKFTSCEVEVSVRSHGSMHERFVPIIGYPRLPEGCKMNLDITALMEL